MSAIYRWDPFRGLNTLNEQVNRLLGDSFAPSGETAWRIGRRLWTSTRPRTSWS